MEQIRERYILAINHLVGRDKQFKNMKAYVAQTGDTYSTINKIINRAPAAFPNVRSILSISVHTNIDINWILTGEKLFKSTIVPPTTIESLEKRLDIAERIASTNE